jgi:hypothetical protein
MPCSQIEAVVTFSSFPGSSAEIVEVAARVFSVVFVVANGRVTDIFQLFLPQLFE